MSMSAIAASGAFQATQGVFGVIRNAERQYKAQSPNPPELPKPEKAPTDTVNISGAGREKANAYETLRSSTKVLATETVAPPMDLKKSALEMFRDQNRVLAADSGGQAASRLSVVA